MNISSSFKPGIFLAISILTMFFLFFNGTAAAQVPTEKQDFSVSGRGQFIFEFALQSPGNVTITANWQGGFPADVTLKDPSGKVYRHKKGNSPLRLEFWVTQQFLEKGGEWRIIVFNESRFNTKGTITITYSIPQSQKAPPHPDERPRPEEHPRPEQGWCCKDGRIFPANIEECREQGGQFFLHQEEAERHCREEHPPRDERRQPEEHPRPEEGWCCKDGRVFPANVEECREREGQFFLHQEEAERHCREEHPQPDERPRPEGMEEGWCCKDGKVFPAAMLECCERRGQFFLTREEAEKYCQEEHPHPDEHPRPEEPERPEGGWCCKDGEVFPCQEAECIERGGQFYVCEEDARRYCQGPEPEPEPEPQFTPPPRRYPAIPTANFDVEGLVPLETLEKVADDHAFYLWGENIARGHPFPTVDRDGNVFAYVFSYLRGSQHFPEYEQIFDEVKSLGGEFAKTNLGAQFGYIYVSATDKHFPIFSVSYFLHPYFYAGEKAQEKAISLLRGNEVRLNKIYLIGPGEEYFEFSSNQQRIFIHINTLEAKQPGEVLSPLRPRERHPDLDQRIKEAWVKAIETQPIELYLNTGTGFNTYKEIPKKELIPIIDYTWWCVPTAISMVVGYWDNYTKGKGTHLGYGRLIDYWFDHPNHGHSVPNIIDEIINPKVKSWRTHPQGWLGTINQFNNYSFTIKDTQGDNSNDWAWKALQAEIDSGKPAMWGASSPKTGHANAAFGYRIKGGQKYVVVYNTYGTIRQQQYKEYNYQQWAEASPSKTITSVTGFRPGGGTNGDHMIIDSPDGGENLTRMVPYNITWWVWGVKIAKSTISFSADGGRNWATIASDVNTILGKNSYQWLPDKATQKARIRIQCYSSTKELIAADGSAKNFTIKTASLNNWGSWKSLGKPWSGHYGIERLVVEQNQDGRQEIFAIGSDGALWNKYQSLPNSATWTGWGNLGKPAGLLLSTAAVERNHDGRLEVVAIASDGALWHRYQSKPNQGPWIGWGSMDKPTGVTKLVANPVISRNQDGTLEVFVFGSDGALWHRYQSKPSAGPWSAWTTMGSPPGGGKFYAHPVVVKNKDGRLEVFAMAGTKGKGEFQLANTALWHKSQPGPNHKGSWGTWQSMGKPFGASWPSPGAGQNKDGRLEVFVPGSDGALWHKYQSTPNSNSWSNWKSIGNPPGGIKVLSQIDAAANKDGRLEVFIFGIRGKGPGSVIAPWHLWQISPNNGWSKWAGLGSPPGKDFEFLTVGQNKDGRLEVFAIASADKSLWHIHQN